MALQSYEDQQLTILRPNYPEWDIWTVPILYPKRHIVWCAKPKRSPVATINAESPEALVAEIARQDAERL